MGGIIIILVVTAILAFFVKDYPILIMAMIAIFGYGVVDVLNGYGLKVTLTRESDIKIPKYDGVLSFNFAKQGE